MWFEKHFQATQETSVISPRFKIWSYNEKQIIDQQRIKKERKEEDIEASKKIGQLKIKDK